jgi:hypothetical protein
MFLSPQLYKPTNPIVCRRLCEMQSREAELERTVQELGAALVARNREHNRINTADRTNSDGSEPNDLNSFRARVEALESDLESANAHLVLERERVSKPDSFHSGSV